MFELSDFETNIISKIATEYPFIHSHLLQLQVTKRDKTGVGLFVHFSYRDESNIEQIPSGHLGLSSNSHLNMDGLENGLFYELSPTNGKIDFLEIVTAGNEQWDGNVRKYWFT